MNKINYSVTRIKKSILGRKKNSEIKWRAQIKKWRSQILDLGNPTAVIWIFGCQRSGTTFLENIFRQDLDSAVFGEFSELTIAKDKTVLNDLEIVQTQVLQKNARYAVIRPLFESNRAIELLDLFPNSVGVWLFRDCPHVVDSMLRKWDNRFFEISKKNESDESGFWRLEQLCQKVKTSLDENSAVKPSLAELYARYWIERNKIPLMTEIKNDRRIIFLSYPSFVKSPNLAIDTIMKKAKMPGIWRDFKTDARINSINRSVDLDISKNTLSECKIIYNNLCQIETNI